MADPAGTATVGAHLGGLRRDSFVGRADELARFAELLGSPRPAFRVVWVHGPGGVGKTALCARFVELARQAGRPVVTVDARDIDLTRQTLAQALGGPEPGQVTIVDTFERCAPLETWLRESLLPSWPADGVLVLAGRRPPSPGWSTDAGWQQLLLVLALRNLRPEESRDFLRSRGLVGAQQESVIAFTHGHPLALALVAEMYAQGRRVGPVRAEQEPELVRVLLERFVDQVPSPRHRAALEVCAHVRVTTEDVLAELLGDEDAGELFAWLRTLSFIEPGPHGLFPHDLARDVLDADLRWRNPARYRELHAAARASVVRRIQTAEGARQERALFDFLFMHRANPLMNRYLDWETFGTVRPAPASDSALPAILAMVERHEGPRSASIAEHWFRRQPHGFTVFLDLDDEIVGFQATLALQEASAEDIAADPAAAAAMTFARRHAPPRPGDAILFHRFYVSRDTYQTVSAATNLFSVVSNRYWLTTPQLAWTFMATSDADYWQPLFAYLNFQRSPEADFEVGRRYAVFSHDWRAEPLPVWFELMAERELATTAEVIAPPPAPSAPTLVVLSEPEFAAAVHQALRSFTRPDDLAASPLLRSRVTVDAAGPRPGPDDLRALLRQAAATLRANPKDEKLYRAVNSTYFEPAPTQEQAAERLGLPFSTYRRHLTAGIDRMCAWLWRRELSGAPPTGPVTE